MAKGPASRQGRELGSKGEELLGWLNPHTLASSGHEHSTSHNFKGTNSVLNSKTQSLPAPLATPGAGEMLLLYWGAWRTGHKPRAAAEQNLGATCAASPICAMLLLIPLACS